MLSGFVRGKLGQLGPCRLDVRLQADGSPEASVVETASAAIAVIEGALLAQVSGQLSHLAHAKRAALTLLATPTAPGKG